MKIGIIGSRGFIGSNLNLYLKDINKYKVYCFSSYKKYRKNWIKQILREIKWNERNLTSPHLVQGVFEYGILIFTIINLADF